jgi:hypothetical protein
VKITRDAFLYLAPRFAPKTRFAQCSTCRDWVTGDRRCVIHGSKITVPGGASCGLYVWGIANPKGTETRARVTPEESGLINREVRCENCKFFGDDECGLYRILNDRLGEYFDLDVKVDAHGCCNAQTPGGDDG